MQRLSGVDELLDGPLDDPQALAGNLRDLARINRWLGGRRLSLAGVRALAGDRTSITVLDIGTGGADIPLALIERGRTDGRHVSVVGLDSRAEVIAAAALVEPRVRTEPGLALQLGDGRSLPFADRSFDVAHVSLVIHHLEPDAAVGLLREMARVARLGIVVNDLVRSRPAWIGAWLLGRLLTRNRYTRHDGPLSVRRAYTVAELTGLIASAGLRVEGVARGPWGHRVGLVARTPATAARDR